MKKLFVLFFLTVLALIFVACNGSGSKFLVEFVNADLENQEVLKGQKLEKPADPVKEGCVFDGWYQDAEFTEPFDFDKEITENTKVYALFYLTLPKAIEIASGLAEGEVTQEYYYVTGKVKQITNSVYGNMYITDDEVDLFVYGVNSRDGSERYESLPEKPLVGDTVYLYGPFKRFKGEIELNNSCLIKMEKSDLPDVDLKDYEEVSIDAARTKTEGAKVVVEGVVATITYGTNYSPNGVYLVDETNAIYVYGNTVATSVEVGNKIKVAGIRTNFILESEKEFAERFGYQGSIQIANTILVDKEEGDFPFPTDWIEEKTIKELLATDPSSENITGTIFKVNAFIHKVPGTGFTNYYFNDLDDATGSYTYTMNNGNDFTWLDKYDGTLKTVYLSVINAKSTASGIIYRFLPIQIVDDFEYDQSYNPIFAVKYYGVDQFQKTYTASPDKELITNVSFEKLDIENVQLTYSSSHENVAYFETDGDKLIFKTGEAGTATITITGKDGENEYSETVEIEVVEAEVEYITVSAAINEEDETEVVVKGIVGASLVNKVGFYLIDETGVIAVEMSSVELSKVELGNEVIIKGRKTHIGAKEDAVGQIAIVEAEVVVNKFGEHEYSTASFKDGKVLADFIDLNKMEDHSTDVYIIEATIKYEATQYYTRYSIIDDEGNSMNIYSSSGNQLKFLEAFQNMKVTLEFTVVNWNGKGYSGSILAVIHNGEKVINDSNFR